MAGGIGAASVVVALWLLAWGALHGAGLVDGAWPDFGRVAIGAAIAGLLVFGGLMFVRNSTDEFFDTAKQIAMERYIADLEAGVALRDQKISDLQVDLNIANAAASVAELRTAGGAQVRGAKSRRRLAPNGMTPASCSSAATTGNRGGAMPCAKRAGSTASGRRRWRSCAAPG